MAKYDRAQAKIERLSRAVGCTPQSIDWMESALDPFPDENRNISGYPDMIAAKSVVQSYRQKTTVSSAGGVNWDCLIAHDGLFTASPVVTQPGGSAVALPQTGQGSTPYTLGGITVRSAASGTNLYLPTVNPAQCMTPSFSTVQPFRVVAMGLEITNTTSELNKQGNIVVFRQPRSMWRWNPASLAATTGVAGYANNYLVMTPLPETPSDALICQGSRSWSAKEGAYLVGTLCTQEIDLQNTASTLYGGVQYTSNAISYLTSITGAGPYYFNQQVFQSPFNQFGAYLTGLSATTTLDVVWHYTVERFPRAIDYDLITMSSASAPYDPKALELYSKTIWHLPVGVPVCENGLGDWLCDVADILGNFGVPGMGIAKGVVKAVSGVSNSFDNHARPQNYIQENEQPYYPPADAEMREQVARAELNAAKKRRKANAPAKIGPMLPSGKFKSAHAKAKKKKRKRKGK